VLGEEHIPLKPVVGGPKKESVVPGTQKAFPLTHEGALGVSPIGSECVRAWAANNSFLVGPRKARGTFSQVVIGHQSGRAGGTQFRSLFPAKRQDFTSVRTATFIPVDCHVQGKAEGKFNQEEDVCYVHSLYAVQVSPHGVVSCTGGEGRKVFPLKGPKGGQNSTLHIHDIDHSIQGDVSQRSQTVPLGLQGEPQEATDDK